MAIPGIFVSGARRLKIIEIPRSCIGNISNVEYKKARMIAIVIGALEAESLLSKYLALVGVMTRKSDSMQQTVELRSAHI